MILVTYATTHGSTEEVADAVAKELRSQNLEVELANCKNVRSVDPYEAVLLGVPLYMFRLHGHARRFLARQEDSLKNMPVALFVLGPFHDDEKEWNDARSQLDKELGKYPWLKPVSQKLFGGKFDPDNMRMPYKMLPALKKLGEGDIRDWDAIREWANTLPTVLKTGS